MKVKHNRTSDWKSKSLNARYTGAGESGETSTPPEGGGGGLGEPV